MIFGVHQQGSCGCVNLILTLWWRFGRSRPLCNLSTTPWRLNLDFSQSWGGDIRNLNISLDDILFTLIRCSRLLSYREEHFLSPGKRWTNPGTRFGEENARKCDARAELITCDKLKEVWNTTFFRIIRNAEIHNRIAKKSFVHPLCKRSVYLLNWTHLTAGLEITAGQRTMSGLIVDLTGQTFVWPVKIQSYWKWNKFKVPSKNLQEVSGRTSSPAWNLWNLSHIAPLRRPLSGDLTVQNLNDDIASM